MEYRFDDCILDTARRTLTRADHRVAVEPQVFDLILLLLRNAGRVVTRDELIEVVWGGRIVSESAISARIAAARKAVGDDGKRQAVIRTVPRRGLQMATTVTEPDNLEIDDAVTLDRTTTQLPSIRYTKNVRGRYIAYALSGDGPPVLRTYPAAHLEAEWSATRERAVFSLLQARNSLLRYDYVGGGMSERMFTVSDFEHVAEDIRSVADAAGLDSFALYSESGGVHAALRFAAQYPERVTKLVIVGGYVDGRSRRSLNPAPDFLRSMIDEGWTDPQSSLVRAFCLAYAPEGPIDEVYEHADVAFRAVDRDFGRVWRDAINDVSNGHLVDQVRCPTLILHGRRDAIHPLSEAQKLATGIANSELVVLDTANHLTFPGHPTWGIFASAVQQFLDS